MNTEHYDLVVKRPRRPRKGDHNQVVSVTDSEGVEVLHDRVDLDQEEVRRKVVDRIAQRTQKDPADVEAVLLQQLHLLSLTPEPHPRLNTTGDKTARPEISVSGRHMRDITRDSVAVLAQDNDPPRIFQRGSELVRLDQDHLTANRLDHPTLRGILDRAADFMTVKYGEDGLEESRSPARPPTDVVADILTQQHLPFPVLNGFASTPVFLPGGSMLLKEGYDSNSGIYLQLAGLEGLQWGLSLEEAQYLTLDELMGDFPFANDASRAHTLAAILLPFVRPMINGPTPLHLLDAPARGTGKGLLADLIGIVTNGVPPSVMSPPENEDELEKRITATLLGGSTLILLDNVKSLHSAPLCAVLTTTRWQGRLLGKSQMVHAPNNATWLATGNNVSLSDEMNRRVVLIRMDARLEAPEERSEFKHQLPNWAFEHRPDLVSACMSIVKRWVDAGMPRGQAALGRFEDWAAVLGGICQFAGVPGFLTNRTQQRSEDWESEEWAALCSKWYSAHGSKPVGAKEVLASAKNAQVLLGLWV